MSSTSSTPIIGKWSVEALPDDSKFVHPRRIKFEYKGRSRVWDICLCHDAVCSVVYHKEKDALIFVQQFRPAVYNMLLKEQKDGSELPPLAGFTNECCAGICDKDMSLQHMAQEEVVEELGLNPPVETFEKVISYRTAVGVLGYQTSMFYVEVDDSMKVSEGGGIESEDIHLVYVPVKDLESYLFKQEVTMPSGLQFAILWFLRYKVDKKPKPLL
jgi:UDP-sugar diphosphatase